MPTHRKLRRVSIEGFRSIKKCDLELNSINILIGSNGAGKTNFISAFVLLQNILKKELQVYSSQSGSNALLYKGSKTTSSIRMNFDFTCNSYGFELIPASDGRMIFKDEYYEFNGTRSSIISSRGSMESHWEEGVENGMDRYVMPVLKNEEWRVYHFHDTSRTSKIKQEGEMQNNTSLTSDAGNIAAFLYRLRNEYPNHYRNILETVKLVAPFISDFVLEPYGISDQLIMLRWRQVGCEETFGPSQLSDGTIRFICLTTLLLQPERFQPSTIIIDEPELGLHPYAIMVLSDMIREASKRMQIIISTQSVELLDEFNSEDVVIVETDSNGTRFKRLNEDDLRIWLNDDYHLGELWKKNILGGRP